MNSLAALDKLATTVPPEDPNAEVQLLAHLLLDPELLDEVRHLIAPSHFRTPLAQEVAATIYALDADDQWPDLSTVIRRGRSDHSWESRDLDTIEDWVSSGAMVSPAGATQWARAIRDDAILRRTLLGLGSVMELLQRRDPGAFPALREILEAAEGDGEQAGGHIADGIDEAVHTLVSTCNLGAGEGGNLPWGIHELDNYGGFIRPGDFPIVAGAPGSGKTTWVARLALDTALRTARPVIFVSLEMPAQQLREKLILSEAGIPDPSNRGLLGEGRQRVEEAAQYLRTAPLYLPDRVPSRIDDFDRWLRGVIHKEKPVLVCLDYLGQLRGNGGNATEQVTDCSIKVRAIAKDTGVPVVALHSLNRTQDPHKEPTLSSLRQSGQIEFDGTHVLFLWNRSAAMGTEEQVGIDENSELYLCVKKCRRGRSNFRVRMRFDPSTSRISNWEHTS